ncbi:MAG: Gfo/Idh/MocA family oxidoreductase [Armatimonadetes bacterium]|nr:Gfo/Idh/MocA family oxidoreductase [Armatimonadota bacterium]MDW8122038.1 Gfo/Idh/MocA family oxidoreductase [Armatimonadota bacterium]
MERPIKVCFVGCGGIAGAHLRALRDLPDLFQVVACCDVVSEAAQKRAAEVGGAAVYTDYEEAIKSSGCDVVAITLPHHLHRPVGLVAAQEKKHIFVEKPMANNLTEAIEMVQASEQAGKMLMVGQTQRYMAVHRKVKEILESGQIGRVLYVRASVDQFLAAIRGPGDWLFKKDLAGGGSVISIGVHKIDLLRWLVGEVESVFAVERISGINPGMDCEDISTALLEFEDGAVADLGSLYAARQSPWGELLTIYGSEGVIHNIGGWFLSGNGTGPSAWQALEYERNDPFKAEWEHFGHCLLSGEQPLTSGADNLRTMAVIEAIYLSARSHHPVSVKDLLPS